MRKAAESLLADAVVEAKPKKERLKSVTPIVSRLEAEGIGNAVYAELQTNQKIARMGGKK